ncbi:MAG: RHS repeat-associated core domain-containing protein [Brevundimonas sp.]
MRSRPSGGRGEGASSGRFLQTDPIGYGGGLNWYAYVGNDPLNYDDDGGTSRRRVRSRGEDMSTHAFARNVSARMAYQNAQNIWSEVRPVPTL